MTYDFLITPEAATDRAQIESLLDAAFGLTRRTKTSYRLREGETPVAGLSFTAKEQGGNIVGAISFWRICVGSEGIAALLLGPLAVAPDRQGLGIGLALMHEGLSRAKQMGHTLVILVGDLPYYSRAGFAQVPTGHLLLPGPVDPARLLYLELEPGALSATGGLVLPPHRFAESSRSASDLPGTTSGLPTQA